MSGRSASRQRRDNLAPSLFPFLAVLLCTMGSLVLILMLIVSGAQADAKQIAEEAENRRLEVESLAEHTVRSYQEQLDDGRLELEEERLVLQHFEEHILELQTELSELEKTAQLLREELKPESKEEFEQKLSELEKQLAQATEDLNNQKIEKPDGDKPVFAVIPYEGTSGTHRRPIYLECTEQGIILQPEGNVLSKNDLRPPYGPGNPLDAALRTVRSEYKPENGAITETAYPLLLVRPSGVNTYALARAAMSGWDDQFGYELIAEDLELVFPSTVAGLREKVTQSVELARQRQTALAMAMPRKYRPGNLSSGPYQGTGYGESSRSGLANYGENGGRASEQFGFGSNKEGRGGYSESANGLQKPPRDLPIGGGLRQAINSRAGTNQTGTPGRQSLQEFFGSDGDTLTGGYAPSRGSASGYSTGGTSGDLLSDLQEAAGEPGFAGESQTGISGSSTGATAGAGGSSSSRQSSAAQETGSQFAASGATGGAAAAGSRSPAGGGGSPQELQDGSNANQQGMPQLSLDLSRQQEAQETRPVASSRGRGWAWSSGRQSRTAIVRPVHLHCFSDRWVLLPDNGDVNQSLTIPFEGTPEERAVYLVEAVRSRVDDWGMAVMGGQWRPKIVVDVAPDSDWRFRQLQRLLDGSGIEVEKRKQTANSAAPSTRRQIRR